MPPRVPNAVAVHASPIPSATVAVGVLVVGLLMLSALPLAGGAEVPGRHVAALARGAPTVSSGRTDPATTATPPMSIPAGQVERTLVPWANQTVMGYHRTYFSPQIRGLIYDPSQNDLWVGEYNPFSNVPSPLLLLNTSTYEPIGLDFAVTNSWGFALDVATGTIFITDPFNASVWAVSAVTGALVHPSLAVGGNPQSIAYDPSNGDLYVGNNASDNVSIIDGATEKVLTTAPALPAAPQAMAYDAQTTELYLALADNVTVALNTSTNTIAATLAVGYDPSGVAVNQTSGAVYVANTGDSNLTVIDARTHAIAVPSIGVGVLPVGITWLASTGSVYVVNSGNDNMTVVSSATNLVTVPSIRLPSVPFAEPSVLAPNPSGARLYVSGVAYWYGNYYFGFNVTAISTITDKIVGETTEIGGGPYQSAFDASAGSVFDFDAYSGTIFEYNATSLTLLGAPFTVPELNNGCSCNPQLWFDPAQDELYAALTDGNRLWAFNATTHAEVAQITLPYDNSFSAAIFDPTNDLVYVDVVGFSPDESNLTVLNPITNKLGVAYPEPTVATAEVSQILFDPGTNELYLAFDAILGGLFVFNVTRDAFNSTVIPWVIGSEPFPVSLAYDPVDDLIYACGGNQLALLDPHTHQIVEDVPIDGETGYITYDPDTELLYVTVQAGNGHFPWDLEENLTVIDGATAAAAWGPWTTIYTGFDTVGAGVTFVPSAAPTTLGEIWVDDAFDGSTLVLSVPPFVSSFSATPDPSDWGQRLNFSADVLGGTGLLSYNYTELPTGCVGAGATFTCTPTATGNFSVTLTVRDGLNLTSSLTTDLTIHPALSVTATASTTSTTAGTAIHFNATPAGGAAPYSINWSFGDGGGSNSASASHAYATSGTYVATVTVADSVGQRASFPVAVTITGTSTPSSSSGSNSSTYAWLGVGLVVGVVAGLLAGVLVGRRRRPPPQPYAGPVSLSGPPPPVPPPGSVG
jgi:YVTN family beta-propeller protein